MGRELDDFADPADEEIVFDLEDIPSEIGHKSADMMDMVHDMIIGRIGGRPNIPAEFMQAAANCSPLKQKGSKSDGIYNIDFDEDLPVDIGVLACGPIPLIESTTSVTSHRCFRGDSARDRVRRPSSPSRKRIGSGKIIENPNFVFKKFFARIACDNCTGRSCFS